MSPVSTHSWKSTRSLSPHSVRVVAFMLRCMLVRAVVVRVVGQLTSGMLCGLIFQVAASFLPSLYIDDDPFLFSCVRICFAQVAM